MPANEAARAIAKTTPTVRLPACAASSFAASASTLPDERPTANVNAPCTGWESAEITCHVTTYAPSSRCGRSVWTWLSDVAA